MKKIYSLLLVLAMLLSLCACSGTKSPVEGGSTATGAPVEEESKIAAEAITLNSTIDLDYVTMTLDAFEVSTGYNFEHTDTSSGFSVTKKASIDCPSDMKLVCLRGKFTNKTTSDKFPANNPVYGELVINGYTYETKMKCYISETAESVLELSPMRAVDYYLYAEVPATVADAIESCTLNMGFVTDLDASKFISELSDNDKLYTLEAMPVVK